MRGSEVRILSAAPVFTYVSGRSRSVPGTYLTVYTEDIGNTFGLKGLSSSSSLPRSPVGTPLRRHLGSAIKETDRSQMTWRPPYEKRRRHSTAHRGPDRRPAQRAGLPRHAGIRDHAGRRIAKGRDLPAL